MMLMEKQVEVSAAYLRMAGIAMDTNLKVMRIMTQGAMALPFVPMRAFFAMTPVQPMRMGAVEKKEVKPVPRPAPAKRAATRTPAQPKVSLAAPKTFEPEIPAAKPQSKSEPAKKTTAAAAKSSAAATKSSAAATKSSAAAAPKTKTEEPVKPAPKPRSTTRSTAKAQKAKAPAKRVTKPKTAEASAKPAPRKARAPSASATTPKGKG